MFDYACFLVKFITYRNLMCIQKIYFLPESCKNAIASKNLARMPLHPRILQECHCIQESYKNAIVSKNLAKIEFFVRILQDFLNLQKKCKILQEINFLSTRIMQIVLVKVEIFSPKFGSQKVQMGAQQLLKTARKNHVRYRTIRKSKNLEET